MDIMFHPYRLGNLELPNRFIFPPIKTGYGDPAGTVTERQLAYYRQIAKDGPGIIILEPVSVTSDGREHSRQLRIDQAKSITELQKIVKLIHRENRLACLHLNHAGGAANPLVTGSAPKSATPFTCTTSGETAEALTGEEIEAIIAGYQTAAHRALEAGFDLLEVQAGHGYLVSQFLNHKINKRSDIYGENRLAFAEKVLAAIKKEAPDLPLFIRISGDEMSPQLGIERDELRALIHLAEDFGAAAIHVGMGNSCFSPPWYFHHASLPEKPQMDALSWVRQETRLPLAVAGRMGRLEKIKTVLDRDLGDLVALGRPLIADPGLINKWKEGKTEQVRYCGFCLQGCLHRLKNGEPLGCNLNPAVGLPDLETSANPLRVLVAGGGPAGMSATIYMSRRGHRVTLVEKENQLGGQFGLAWQAPGKKSMQAGLNSLINCAKESVETLLMGRAVDAALVNELKPDLLVWATGVVQRIPDIKGLKDQHIITSIAYFGGSGEIRGPRILVIGAGRTGLEIAEKLGRDGYEVVATKRTDPIGGMMEMITKKLALMRIEQMPKVKLMPHTTVKAFRTDGVDLEQDGQSKRLPPFQTVILASGMLSAPGPTEDIKRLVGRLEIIGDADKVQDIYSAVHAGYELALAY
ncbi:MAG: FAD-dependent oxidoreductase [Deltaproteobacteria bacterium]|nr:FAD-dependent oxidoreductase [Deltaproteobacteria bacterium]MBW2131923.1 FAD-dependent oxidoreductase [Deltaproteobacteria bacterium]